MTLKEPRFYMATVPNMGGRRRRMPKPTFVRPMKMGERQGDGVAPQAPGWWPGTQPEWAIFWALERLHLRPDIDYTYIYAAAGRKGQTGYTELDFAIFPYRVGIFVNGEYFHYQQGGAKEAFDRVQYAVAESAGWTVVVIDAADANRAPIYYAKEALNGVTHSRQRALF